MTDQLTLPELKQLKRKMVMQRNQYRIERNHKQHDGVEIELMYINQQIEKLTKNDTRTETINR
jgi:sensor histidine kinase YesM